MPRRTKRWIDPKKSVKYEIVERGTDDVLSSTSGVSQNVLRIVQDKRPRRSREDDPMHVSQTDDGELILEGVVAEQPTTSTQSISEITAKTNSVFEDSDEEDSKRVHSQFSDEEFDGEGSSGIGSEDDHMNGKNELDEESVSHMRTAAPREAGWVPVGEPKRVSNTPLFVRGGYDYGKHMKETGTMPGAVFISKDGKISEFEEMRRSNPPSSGTRLSSNPQMLPSDLFASKPTKEASKADELDRRYGMHEDIDPDVQKLLDDSSDDDNELTADSLLDDDFVIQAIQPVEGEEDELDARAYLDKIIQTGRLPGELDDPFGDDLEDIDDFLSNVPRNKPGKASTVRKSGGSLDDIDDDLPFGNNLARPNKSRRDYFEEHEEDEEMEDFDSDIFEEDDEDLDETERRARKIGRSIPGRAPLTTEEAARAIHKFETTLAEYEDTMELDADDPAAKGALDVSNFTDVLDAFIDDAVLLGLRPASSKSEVKRNQQSQQQKQQGEASSSQTKLNLAPSSSHQQSKFPQIQSYEQGDEGAQSGEDDDDEEQVIYFEGREEPQWDVESYVSTYTNTENHPRLVSEDALNRRIQIGRGGVPTGILEHERKHAAKEERARRRDEDDAYLSSRSVMEDKVNLGIARPKKESPEERKARKESIKVEKKANREAKKLLKTSFRQEAVRQNRQQAGHTRATIVHL